MHLVAKESSGELVSALRALRQRDYFCLECSAAVRLKRGSRRQAHFFHLAHHPGCRQSGKSLAHLQAQLYLQRLIPEAKLEQPLGGRIADLFWEREGIVFEVQCSPISAKEVRERNRDYGALGYDVVWILHERRFSGKKPSSAELFLRGYSHYFTDLDREGRGAIYDRLDASCKEERLVVDFSKPIRAAERGHPRLRRFPLHFRGDAIDLGLRGKEEPPEEKRGSLYGRWLDFWVRRGCRG